MVVVILLTLAVFVLALIYFFVLSVRFVTCWAAGTSPSPRKTAVPQDRFIGGFKHATQEISAIFGLGDD